MTKHKCATCHKDMGLNGTNLARHNNPNGKLCDGSGRYWITNAKLLSS